MQREIYLSLEDRKERRVIVLRIKWPSLWSLTHSPCGTFAKMILRSRPSNGMMVLSSTYTTQCIRLEQEVVNLILSAP